MSIAGPCAPSARRSPNSRRGRRRWRARRTKRSRRDVRSMSPSRRTTGVSTSSTRGAISPPQYVGELQSAAADLQRQVAGLPSDSPATLPLAPFRGALEWPVTGRIVSRFGTRRRRPVRHGDRAQRHRDRRDRGAAGPRRPRRHGRVRGAVCRLRHARDPRSRRQRLHALRTPVGGARRRRARVWSGAQRWDGRARTRPASRSLYFEVRIDGRPVDPVQWLRSSR